MKNRPKPPIIYDNNNILMMTDLHMALTAGSDETSLTGLPVPRIHHCVGVVLQRVLLHGEHSLVPAAAEEPPLVVEVGCPLPRPHRGRGDEAAVTPH